MERRNFLLSGLLVGLDLPSDSGRHDLIMAATDGGPLKPIYIPPSPQPLTEGPSGTDARLKIRSQQTNRQFSCQELLLGPKRMGPAPHLHKELDEIMFVQEGTVSVLVGKEVYEVEAGGWHLRPHGIVHTFWNATHKPARCIDMYFNQDFDNFLEAMFEKLIPDLIKRGVALSSKEATDKMDQLYARYGITMFDEQREPIMAKYGLKG
ncbi:cupin domain-containing protein [Spirosoma harenae]